MNTLKGIFPEPKQPPKRNFLKENMANIKQMQGLMQTIRNNYGVGTTTNISGARSKPAVFRRKSRSVSDQRRKPAGGAAVAGSAAARIITAERPKIITVVGGGGAGSDPGTTGPGASGAAAVGRHGRPIENACCRTAIESLKMSLKEKAPRGRDIGVQTEGMSRRLYDTGTVRYPTAATNEVLSVQTRQKSPTRMHDQSDPNALSSVSPTVKRDYVKENAQVCPRSQTRTIQQQAQQPGNAPPGYRKGVIPKYLRERKEELSRAAAGAGSEGETGGGGGGCPEGHVQLPENERRETLRMLRQSYAELVTELNLMPVRSDTLKVRNRKIELENQLRKLDEGIKVFTRPKVYVKIGA